MTYREFELIAASGCCLLDASCSAVFFLQGRACGDRLSETVGIVALCVFGALVGYSLRQIAWLHGRRRRRRVDRQRIAA
ncbi:MAG: hypothetical protein ACRYGR_08610 [Janthinobacterium lividum]